MLKKRIISIAIKPLTSHNMPASQREGLHTAACHLTSNFRQAETRSTRDVYQNMGDRYVRKCLRDVIRTRKLVPPLGVMRALILIYRCDAARLHNDIPVTCVTNKSGGQITPQTVVKILEKKFAIAWKRKLYLESIQKYRDLGYPIVYIDEAWFTYSASGCQGHYRRLDRNERPIKTSYQTMVIHAGGATGFLPGTLMTRSVTNPCTNHTQSGNSGNKSGVDARVFSEYVTRQLLPNVSRNSVIVMDNASFHRRELDQCNSTSFIDVLDRYTKLCCSTTSDSTINSAMLYRTHESGTDSARPLIPPQGQGHVFLRLPPYHTVLNPIELAWGDLRLLLKHDGSCKSLKSGEELDALLKSKIPLIDESRWKLYMDKVVAKEQLLREAEMLC